MSLRSPVLVLTVLARTGRLDRALGDTGPAECELARFPDFAVALGFASWPSGRLRSSETGASSACGTHRRPRNPLCRPRERVDEVRVLEATYREDIRCWEVGRVPTYDEDLLPAGYLRPVAVAVLYPSCWCRDLKLHLRSVLLARETGGCSVLAMGANNGARSARSARLDDCGTGLGVVGNAGYRLRSRPAGYDGRGGCCWRMGPGADGHASEHYCLGVFLGAAKRWRKAF